MSPRTRRQEVTVPAPDAAERLLDKLRRFAGEELDAEERVMLGVLLAPGVLAAAEPDDVEGHGFGFAAAGRHALAASLRDALRRSGVHVAVLEARTEQGPAGNGRG